MTGDGAIERDPRVAGALGAKVVQRMSTKLQMGDERVVAHVD